MKTLGRHLKDYLKLRRQLGFKLIIDGFLLRNFVCFARQQGATFISTKLALRWIAQPINVTQSCRAHRLSAVRGFAKYLSTIEPRAEVPARTLIPIKVYRREPYPYTDKQILQLIDAARKQAPSQKLRGLTLATLLGLLAVTGMRVGEALALDSSDIDFAGALLTIRRAKGNKTRLIPLHASAVEALRRYGAIRDEVYPQPTGPAFFIRKGVRLSYNATMRWFHRAAFQAGLRQRGDGRGGPGSPRMHDLRHCFAIRTLLNWYHDDADVEARLPELTTFLGHATVRDTCWYLSARPELLELATRRWEKAEKGGK